MNKTIGLLERKIERLQKALEQSEQLLENKSREIFLINKNLENEVKNRTHEMELSRDSAIKANQAKSQFLANMSHEIRTPLNGIIGFLDLLSQSKLDNLQRDQLSIIQSSTDYLLQIITDILEFSKIEAGKIQIDPKPFDIKKCVESIADTLAVQIYKKKLDFIISIDERIPDRLVGDEGKVRQILMNLLSNALKYTHSGEVGIRVEYDSHNSQNYQLKFIVFDTGVGIPNDKLETIFMPFEQADVSDTRKYGGTGLGLSISRQLAVNMGGRLEVQSQEAKGTKFFLYMNFSIPNGELPQFNKLYFSTNETFALVGFTQSENITLRQSLESFNGLVHIYRFNEKINWVTSKNSKRNIIINVNNCENLFERIQNIRIEHKDANLILLVSPLSLNKVQDIINDSDIKILRKPFSKRSLFDTINLSVKIIDERQSINKSSQTGDPRYFHNTNNRVLIVDDNLINQQLLSAIITSLGVHSDIAINGKEAVNATIIKEYDLILMDCQMPIMDGFESTKMIRESYKELPIIALTANAYKKTKEACFESGMTDFLTKPIKKEDIEELFKKYLVAS